MNTLLQFADKFFVDDRLADRALLLRWRMIIDVDSGLFFHPFTKIGKNFATENISTTFELNQSVLKRKKEKRESEKLTGRQTPEQASEWIRRGRKSHSRLGKRCCQRREQREKKMKT
jgi:hypothetical protein